MAIINQHEKAGITTGYDRVKGGCAFADRGAKTTVERYVDETTRDAGPVWTDIVNHELTAPERAAILAILSRAHQRETGGTEHIEPDDMDMSPVINHIASKEQSDASS